MKDDVIEKPDPSRVVDHGINLSIISLGEKCWSRIFPEVFHLYNFKAKKVRMPFDGSITKYGSMCELINTNFKEVFRGIKTFKDNNGTDIIETDFSHYNHEKNNDFDEFKIQMKKRISQFEYELQSNKQIIFFVLQHRNFPRKLISILKEKYPKLKFKIICINKFADKTKQLRNEDSEYCRYIETNQASGPDYDKQVLDVFLTTIGQFSNLNYDADLIFSKRAKNP